MSAGASEENAWWRRWALILAACLAFIGATRWPFEPTHHLYHLDNVNFALALHDFNPAKHQPQPPGDPMYVALTRWLEPFVPSVELLFPLTGVLGSAAAIAALWWLGEMMFGARVGAAAALLLAVHPIFWLAGIGNYVRVYLALGAAIAAGFTWKSLDGSQGYRWGYGCAATASLGLFAGFRPEMGVLLSPLVLLPMWQRAKWWQWLVCVACGVATALPWFLVTASHSGGLIEFYRLNHEYLAMQSRHSSWFYGASLTEGLRMAAASLYWNLLGAIPWIAFVPLAWRPLREQLAARSQAVRFLALWFVPPFLFYTLVHIHNPDHALAAIPAVCLAGGWVLSGVPRKWFAWCVAGAASLSVVLFFYPTSSPFWASNYRIAAYTIRTDEQVYSRVALMEKMGRPLTVLLYDPYVTSREIDYYFPKVPVLDLQYGAALFVNGRSGPAPERDGQRLILAGRMIWLDPVASSEAGVFDGLRQAVGGQPGSEGPVHWANLPAGTRFKVGGDSFLAVEPESEGKMLR